MAARSKARKRALDILFEADLRGTDPVATLADRLGAGGAPLPAYAVELVEGVAANRPRIDEILSTYAEGWTLDRMPGVDRGILRIGLYELLWRDDVPDAVAIDEAVELAKSLSTDESPRFVNGVLGRIVLVRPSVQERPTVRGHPDEPQRGLASGSTPRASGASTPHSISRSVSSPGDAS